MNHPKRKSGTPSLQAIALECRVLRLALALDRGFNPIMALIDLQSWDNVMQQAQAATAMRERAVRADVAAALAILDRAPDVPPDPGDELL